MRRLLGLVVLLGGGIACPTWSAAQSATSVPKAPGRICANDDCVTTTPAPAPAPAPASPDGVKWNPGHYVRIGGTLAPDKLPQLESELADICSNRNIKGVSIQPYWKMLEGDKRGDYSAGFALIDDILESVAACNKQLMIHLKERDFGARYSSVVSPSKLTKQYPAYLMTSEYGPCCSASGTQVNLGGVVASGADVAWTGNLRSISRTWDPAVMDRLIALSQAYARRYDEHPNFEMLSLGESTVGAPSFDATGYYKQLKRWYSEAAKHWPHTVMRMTLNFVRGDSTMLDLIEHCSTLSNCAVGGPDPELPLPDIERRIQANQVFRGVRCEDCVAKDFRGTVAWVGEVQDLGLTVRYNETPREVQTYQMKTMNNSYMVWNRNGVWSEIVKQINADPSVASTDCPANFPACN